MKKFPVIDIGVTSKLNIRSQFIVRVINLIAVVIVLSIFTTIIVFDPGVFIIVCDLFFMIGALLALYFNSKHNYFLAKLLILVFIPVLQFGLCYMLDGIVSGRMLAIFPLCCVALVAFKNQIFGFVVSAVIIVLVILGSNIDGFELNPVLTYNIVFLGLTIWLGVFLFVKSINRWAKELTTQNRKLNKQNQELNKLIQQNESKNQLLAILSHDLKAPVSAFDKLADKVAYLMKKGDYDQLYKLADYYEASGKKLFTNIERLLNWAMSQKKSIRIVRSKFKLYDLLQELHDSLQYWIKEKNLNIKYYVDRDAMIYSDQEILFIILKNLIENAVKYSPEGSKIDIRYIENIQSYDLEVINQGATIAPDIIENLDQGKFNRKSDSFGLGLSICQSLISTMGGKLIFESTGEKTTKAIVRLDRIIDEPEMSKLESNELVEAGY